MVVKRFGVLSCAKVAGVLYAGIGLLIGAFVSLASLAGAAFGGASGGGENALIGLIFGVAGVIVLPILYGALGFIFIGLFAALYNLIAKYVGGIEVEMG